MSGLNVRDGGASERSHRGEEGGEREEGRQLRGTGPWRLASVSSSLFAQHNGMSAL